MKYSIIYWFRKSLRVHDNPALVRAVEEAIIKNVSVNNND
jgi:deoxyribodipyrimidine photolyase